MTNRAYAQLEIKSVDTEQRIIEGRATSVSVDREKDVILSANAKISLPCPLLYEHNTRAPVGEIFAALPSEHDIQIKAKIAKIEDGDPSSYFRQLTDQVWSGVRNKLLRGLSIGFLSHESEPLPSGGVLHKQIEILECSVVCIPANIDAQIHVIRALDQQAMQASLTGAMSPEFAWIGGLVQAIAPSIRRQIDERVGKGIADSIARMEREITKSMEPLQNRCDELAAEATELRHANDALRERMAAVEPITAMSSLFDEMRELRSAKGWNWRGPWKADESYSHGDVCVQSDATWFALTDTKHKPGDGPKEASGWQLMLKSPKPGASAYDIARKFGFRGDERDWIASLRGSTVHSQPTGIAEPRK